VFRSGKFFAFSRYLDVEKRVVVQFSLLPEHAAETLTDAFFQAFQAHQGEVAMMVKLGSVEVCHLPLEHQASYIMVQHPFVEETIIVCQDCQALRVEAMRNPPAGCCGCPF